LESKSSISKNFKNGFFSSSVMNYFSLFFSLGISLIDPLFKKLPETKGSI